MSEDWTLIGRGFGIAAVGSLGVMAYILGLSNLYVGFYVAGLGCLVGAIILLALFRHILGPFLDRLGEGQTDNESGGSE